MAVWQRTKRIKDGITNRKFGYLVDGKYDPWNNCALLIFLDPVTNRTFTWRDKSGHLSYLYTDADPDTLKIMFGKDDDYVRSEIVKKYDAIKDEIVSITKLTAMNPYSIGGKQNSYRNILQEEGYEVWEAWVHYHNSYCYDNGLEFGMPYYVYENRIEPYVSSSAKRRRKRVIEQIGKAGYDNTPALDHFVRLFEADIPDFQFVAVDIEVLPHLEYQVPDATDAKESVIAVSFVDNRGRGYECLYMLDRDDVDRGDFNVFEGMEFKVFKTEKQLLEATFKKLGMYNIVVTFNGDAFDLKYLYNRAVNLGVPKKANPLYVSKFRNESNLRYAQHLDLYTFFKNASIQNYAFKAKYKRYSLNAISEALLGKQKIEHDDPIAEMSMQDLGEYCVQDSMLVAELMKYNNNLVINLLVTLSRMANLTFEQVCRTKISTWTKSTFYYWHRLNNILIPSKDELASRGSIQTGAVIKGKKYQGAIVHEPKPGVYFRVIVMDFASLYPSEVKERNICYSTINCKHPECQDNKVPDTTHHVCIRNKGICAEIVGALRDARVGFYKKEAGNDDNPLKVFYGVFEQAIKVYINASYGVFGSDDFALYCAPVAETITAYARRDMGLITGKAEEMEIVVIGGDTDSIFLYNPTWEQVEDMKAWSLKELQLSLGVDAVFRYGIFSKRKKNYLGVKEDGSLTIKGLSGKKAHIPPFIKKAFNEVTKLLSEAMTEEDVENAKLEIMEISKRYVNILKTHSYELKDLAFEVTLRRPLDDYVKTTPQHVKAARILQELGHQIVPGQPIRYIKGVKKGVIPINGDRNIDKKKIDTKKYIEQLESVLVQLLDPLEIEFQYHILGVPKPSKLGDFLPQNVE